MGQLTSSLTQKQVSILRYIIRYKEEHHGEGPTSYRQISQDINVAPATVFNARKRFIELGIARETGDGNGNFELNDGRWEWLGEDVGNHQSG